MNATPETLITVLSLSPGCQCHAIDGVPHGAGDILGNADGLDGTLGLSLWGRGQRLDLPGGLLSLEVLSLNLLLLDNGLYTVYGEDGEISNILPHVRCSQSLASVIAPALKLSVKPCRSTPDILLPLADSLFSKFQLLQCYRLLDNIAIKV